MIRKHSIIIGGTKGVGRELACLLAASAQHVTAVGRNPGEFPAVSGGQIEGFTGTAEEPDTLTAFLRDRVAAYKVPRRILFFADGEIPMTSSGSKVRDPELAALVAARIADLEPAPTSR